MFSYSCLSLVCCNIFSRIHVHIFRCLNLIINTNGQQLSKISRVKTQSPRNILKVPPSISKLDQYNILGACNT